MIQTQQNAANGNTQPAQPLDPDDPQSILENPQLLLNHFNHQISLRQQKQGSTESLYITAITFHIESIFTEAGMESTRGFAMFPAAALVGIAASLIGGFLSDRIALRYLYKFFLLTIGGSMTGFIFLSAEWIPLITICFGLSSGLFGLLMGITWPKYFGREHLGAISGLNMAMLVFGSAIGPMFLSLSLKLFASYRTSLLVCLSITLLLFIGSFFAHNPQKKYS